MTRRIAVSLVVAASLVTASASEAHTLPISYAKSKAVPAVKRYWRDEQFTLRSRVRLYKCRRLSRHSVKCGSEVAVEDEYGCGTVKARVTVRYVFKRRINTVSKVSHTVFYPFYDPTNLEFQPESCLAV